MARTDCASGYLISARCWGLSIVLFLINGKHPVPHGGSLPSDKLEPAPRANIAQKLIESLMKSLAGRLMVPRQL